MRYFYLLFTLCFTLFTSCNNVKNSVNKPQEMKQYIVNIQQNVFEKHKEGVDFYAEGENGLWTLALDFDKQFEFTTKKGLVYTAAAVLPIQAQDYNVKRYRAVTDKGELIVQIIKSNCETTISNNKGYKVTVNYKAAIDNDYLNFKGCGTYIPNFRLHNIWAIVEVNGTKIDPSIYKKNAPMLEINCSKQTVMGADGCNTFRGKIYNEYNRIYFNQLASTKMACAEQQNITQKIYEVLAAKRLTYLFENNLLSITNQSHKQLILKPID